LRKKGCDFYTPLTTVYIPRRTFHAYFLHLHHPPPAPNTRMRAIQRQVRGSYEISHIKSTRKKTHVYTVTHNLRLYVKRLQWHLLVFWTKKIYRKQFDISGGSRTFLEGVTSGTRWELTGVTAYARILCTC